MDLAVGSGACYTGSAGFTSANASRVVAGGVDGNLYVFGPAVAGTAAG